jgi:Arc/MetJ family transcription regulator
MMCMRTNIDIDDAVLHEAQELLGTQTKRATVEAALREVIARHHRLGILQLRGKVHWQGDLEASREGRGG